MARSRNIKPAFFDNDELGELNPETRLLFIGLWCLADREGRLENRPKRINAKILPYDNYNVEEMLNSLSGSGFIKLYIANDQQYIQITNWTKHQNPHHKEIASVIPAPENHKDTVCDGYIPLSNTIRKRIYKRDGKICACCKSTEALEIDHIKPVSMGGNSIDINLQVLCKSCNVKKLNKTINFKELSNDGLSLIQSWFKHGLSITQEQINEIASCSTDSLNLIPDSLNLIPGKKNSRFKPPSLQEVLDYCMSRNNSVKPGDFINHYEANGWMRGKTKIKSWKACVRTWEGNQKQSNEPNFDDTNTDWVVDKPDGVF